MPKPMRPNMTLREQEDAAKIQCYDWNAQHKEGVTVNYEELLGSGETIQTKTCGRAFVMCCQAVIMVEDVSGAVSLDHCTVIAEHRALQNNVLPTDTRKVDSARAVIDQSLPDTRFLLAEDVSILDTNLPDKDKS